MKTFLVLTLCIYIPPMISGDATTAKPVATLCDNPIINAADRLPNNTVRVYRGEYYWELLNMPSK